jgi:hypothetical protein
MTPSQRWLCGLAAVNWLAYITGYWVVGGTAAEVSEHHYYLSHHGHFIQVSWPVFGYSFVHTASLLITQALGMCSLISARLRAEVGQ